MIALDTLENDKVYKIFAIVKVNEGYANDFIENNFDTDGEYGEYLNKIYENSILTTSVGVSTSLPILTVIAESGAQYTTIIFARELYENGYENIVCAQPFGCLPNHICGKYQLRLKLQFLHTLLQKILLLPCYFSFF